MPYGAITQAFIHYHLGSREQMVTFSRYTRNIILLFLIRCPKQEKRLSSIDARHCVAKKGDVRAPRFLWKTGGPCDCGAERRLLWFDWRVCLLSILLVKRVFYVGRQAKSFLKCLLHFHIHMCKWIRKDGDKRIFALLDKLVLTILVMTVQRRMLKKCKFHFVEPLWHNKTLHNDCFCT